MKYYFSIQYKRIKRWFREIGVNPYIGIILLGLVMFAASVFLFYKTNLAKWVYPFFALYFVYGLGDQDRTNQLKIIYSKVTYLKIRLIENGITCVPFAIYLLCRGELIISVALLICSLFLALLEFEPLLSRVIPTPFKKLPFEYIVGFRKSIIFIVFVYGICYKAVQVANYNLAIVSLVVLFLILMSYYLKPEDTFYVWIFKTESRAFIKHKMIISIICASILSLPLQIALVISFPDKVLVTLVVILIAYLFLYSIIVAKYSSYPSEMSLAQGILYAISLWFPPMLIVVIPLFYKRAKANLIQLLE